MTDISSFLRARLDDDERVAHDARQDKFGDTHEMYVIDDDYRNDTIAISSNRVLADVAGKRGIMRIHSRRSEVLGVDRWWADACYGCGEGGICDDPNVEDIQACPELRLLASVYADHPDFDPTWTVTG